MPAKSVKPLPKCITHDIRIDVLTDVAERTLALISCHGSPWFGLLHVSDADLYTFLLVWGDKCAWDAADIMLKKNTTPEYYSNI